MVHLSNTMLRRHDLPGFFFSVYISAILRVSQIKKRDVTLQTAPRNHCAYGSLLTYHLCRYLGYLVRTYHLCRYLGYLVRLHSLCVAYFRMPNVLHVSAYAVFSELLHTLFSPYCSIPDVQPTTACLVRAIAKPVVCAQQHARCSDTRKAIYWTV